MEIVRCPVGHFYDKEKDSTCPVCARDGLDDRTQAVDGPDVRPRQGCCTIELEGVISISYNAQLGTFEVTPEHESLVHLNGRVLTRTTPIKLGDELNLGNTRVNLTPSREFY